MKEPKLPDYYEILGLGSEIEEAQELLGDVNARWKYDKIHHIIRSEWRLWRKYREAKNAQQAREETKKLDQEMISQIMAEEKAVAARRIEHKRLRVETEKRAEEESMVDGGRAREKSEPERSWKDNEKRGAEDQRKRPAGRAKSKSDDTDERQGKRRRMS